MAIKLIGKKTEERGRQRPNGSATNNRPAFSYYAADKSRAAPTETRARKKTGEGFSFKRLRMLPTYIALLAIFISIVYSTTLSTVPTVIFAGAESPYYTSAEYQALMQKSLSGSLANRSKLTIDTGRVEKAFLVASPELDAAKLVLPVVGRRPTLTIHVRQPALVLTTKTNAFILDSTGRAVADAKRLPSSTRDKLLSLQDDSGLEIKTGEQAVTNDTVTFIDNVRQQLTSKNLKIVKLVLPATPNEVDIYIEGIAYFVKADTSGDARLQIGAFLAARQGLGAKQPAEYMDVRVEEKVFYK